MSDLISREATIKVIKSYFKSTIDESDGEIDHKILEYSKYLCQAIRELPVAYDVDKVVERLKEYLPLGCSDTEDLMPVCKAIEVVKGAVKDE